VRFNTNKRAIPFAILLRELKCRTTPRWRFNEVRGGAARRGLGLTLTSTSPQQYADEINRWKDYGNLVAAVSQDLMCEPFILHKTGLTIEEHQPIERRSFSENLHPAF
jgi:hypothetical protein